MPNCSHLARLRRRAVLIWRGGRQKLDRLADLLVGPSDDAYGDPNPIFCARATPAAPAQLPASDRALRREVADLRRELETLRNQSNFRADSLAAGLSVVFGYSKTNRDAAAELRAELLRHRREFDQFAGETNRKIAADDLQRHAHGQRLTDLRDESEAIHDAIRAELFHLSRKVDEVAQTAGRLAGEACSKLQAEVNNVRNAQTVYQSRNEAFRLQAIQAFRDSSQLFKVLGHDIQELRERDALDLDEMRSRVGAAENAIRSAALADLNPLDVQTIQDVEDLLRRMREMEVLFSARTNLLGGPSQN